MFTAKRYYNLFLIDHFFSHIFKNFKILFRITAIKNFSSFQLINRPSIHHVSFVLIIVFSAFTLLKCNKTWLSQSAHHSESVLHIHLFSLCSYLVIRVRSLINGKDNDISLLQGHFYSLHCNAGYEGRWLWISQILFFFCYVWRVGRRLDLTCSSTY